MPVKGVIMKFLDKKVKDFCFVDDNKIGQKTYVLELIEALTHLKIRWGAQTFPKIADEREHLGLAAKSGCGILSVGLSKIPLEIQGSRLRGLV